MAAKTGTRHHFSKLSPAKVIEMREWYAEGNISFLELSHEFDVSESTARDAIRGNTWWNVPHPTIHDCPTCEGRGRVRK